MTTVAGRMLDAALWRLPGGRRPLAARARRRYERHVVRSAVRDVELFRNGAPLPEGYGAGLSERAVEYGWTFAQGPRGNVLDAGSTANHPYVLDALLPGIDALTIVTLSPEPRSFPERGVTYRYHDLRELPFPDRTFDTILCLSVLEHVGLDTSRYGCAAPVAADPQREAVRAVRELARVAAAGADLLVSVPFGRAQRLDWVRVLDEAQLRELVDASGARDAQIAVFRDRGGWRRSSLAEAADAGFRRYRAEAVACVRLRL